MKDKQRKNLIISIVLLLLLGIGIGFAYLTSNLSINGQTEIAGNSWNIHFENLNVTTGSVTATTPATIASNTVDITYAISLARPKDFYEFTVDVKNDGTLPGKVSISNLAGVTSAAAPVIDYTIKYTDGNPVQVGDILNAGAKKTIKVRVFYKDNISASDLPSTNINLSLTYTLQYIQSDEEGAMTLTDKVMSLSSNNSCIVKYNGQVTDQPGETVTASNVYYDGCANKRSVIFAGFCWQVVRTTESGGTKVIYDGYPIEGTCESSRADYAFSGDYAIIDNTSFNSINHSMGLVGYMYNTLYDSYRKAFDSSTYKFGNTFTYSNGTYTLSGTTANITLNSLDSNAINNTHYTCWNTTGTCSNISYVFYMYSSSMYYINLSNGKRVEDAIDEMLFADDVNMNDSRIKEYIEAWYSSELASYNDYIEDVVYCNDRRVIDLGGWNPNGSAGNILKFKSYSSSADLSCPTITDQFAVSNNKAELYRPAGLLRAEELTGMNNFSLFDTGGLYWTISPHNFACVADDCGGINVISSYGGMYGDLLNYESGIRPVISIDTNIFVSSGTGTETDPWIIE